MTNNYTDIVYTEDEIFELFLIFNGSHESAVQLTNTEADPLIGKGFIKMVENTQNKIYPSYELTPAGYIYATAQYKVRRPNNA